MISRTALLLSLAVLLGTVTGCYDPYLAYNNPYYYKYSKPAAPTVYTTTTTSPNTVSYSNTYWNYDHWCSGYPYCTVCYPAYSTAYVEPTYTTSHYRYSRPYYRHQYYSKPRTYHRPHRHYPKTYSSKPRTDTAVRVKIPPVKIHNPAAPLVRLLDKLLPKR